MDVEEELENGEVVETVESVEESETTPSEGDDTNENGN